ncbi:hypothetical protein [Streptomyces sp. NPDC002588]|uniref:hypothetical protein n=1 Tax=Streptomyces sp. NPDC002588 TaxID=3154419 RepID=UPI0033176015
MVIILATALSLVIALLTALMALVVLTLKRGGESTARTTGRLLGLLPVRLSRFFARVGRLVIHASRPRSGAASLNRVGARLHIIGMVLPKGDQWRIEEMMEHRNTLRTQAGRVPRFHYVRLFLGACGIRWEERRDPKRQVD